MVVSAEVSWLAFVSPPPALRDQCKTLPLDDQVENNHPSPLMLKGELKGV